MHDQGNRGNRATRKRSARERSGSDPRRSGNWCPSRTPHTGEKHDELRDKSAAVGTRHRRVQRWSRALASRAAYNRYIEANIPIGASGRVRQQAHMDQGAGGILPLADIQRLTVSKERAFREPVASAEARSCRLPESRQDLARAIQPSRLSRHCMARRPSFRSIGACRVPDWHEYCVIHLYASAHRPRKSCGPQGDSAMKVTITGVNTARHARAWLAAAASASSGLAIAWRPSRAGDSERCTEALVRGATGR